MASGNPFIGLTQSQLESLQTVYLGAVTALASAQSYAINGRQLSRADLPAVKETLGEIGAALDDVRGNTTDRTLLSFTGL